MYNPESVQENETHRSFWDFEIQTDHLISVRRPELVIVKKKKKKKNKRTCCIVDFAIPADQMVKQKENEKKDNYQDLARELKKTTESESDGDTDCNRCTRSP